VAQVHPVKNTHGHHRGFRLEPGKNIDQFVQGVCRVNPNIPGFLINGDVFPNPLVQARNPDLWGQNRPIDVAIGFIHGDLNTNNILVKFSENREALEGFYLIDFALFKEQQPLFYDQRYLEMSYLIHSMSNISFAKCVDLIMLLAKADMLESHKVPIEMAGATAVITSARSAFDVWVQENHPSQHGRSEESWAREFEIWMIMIDWKPIPLGSGCKRRSP